MHLSQQRIEKAKKEILYSIDSDILIVVEGKKDREALEKIGFKNIFVLNETGKSLYEKIEKISSISKTCTILTDFDKKGKKLYLFLKSELQKKGIKVNSSLRTALLKLNISHIEGLDTFIKHNIQ